MPPTPEKWFLRITKPESEPLPINIEQLKVACLAHAELVIDEHFENSAFIGDLEKNPNLPCVITSEILIDRSGA